MLSAEENETLTRVGPGTPMGTLLRRYWTPALLSEELPEPDGAPVEVKLLGEDLVAFRDTSGAVGLLQQRCPHRGTSLVHGRNEESGLRCIYHGWKFGVDGRCQDLPTEPAGSPLQAKLRATAYPTEEAGGVVWAYLGPADRRPPFPRFSWLDLPQQRVHVWKISQECNFLQMVERDVDSAHISVLHRRKGPDEIRATLGEELAPEQHIARASRDDTCPRIEVEETAYGFRYAAIRPAASGKDVVRIYPFVYPWHPFIPPFPSGYHVTHAFVAKDDVQSWHYLICYDPDGPIDVRHYEETRGLQLDGYDKRVNRANRYRQDREAMKASTFSGIEGVIMEDHAIVELQGDIADRTQEHLSGTDAAIVTLRRQLLDAVAMLQGGGTPAILPTDLPYHAIAGETLEIGRDEDWRVVRPLPPALRAERRPKDCESAAAGVDTCV